MCDDLIILILTGGLLGILGQGIRMIVGLKKWYDDQKSNPGSAEEFDTKRMWVSIFIGFVAGSLGILFFDNASGTDSGFDPGKKENLLTLIGIGYAGVDFIEGFITKYLPKPGTSAPGATPSSAPPVNPAAGEG